MGAPKWAVIITLLNAHSDTLGTQCRFHGHVVFTFKIDFGRSLEFPYFAS